MSDVKRFEHTTVMRDEVVRALAPRAGGTYVDATLGGGGHTVAILEAEPQGAHRRASTAIRPPSPRPRSASARWPIA